VAEERQGDATPDTPPELQAFADVRGRPAVFLFLSESMSLTHVFQLRRVLGSRSFPEVDLVINSGGGDINAAYQIITLLRLHAKKINACVPFYAKSAATLLCVGSDVIVLDELAQLGPLDTQVYEERKGGKSDYASALNPFKTLEQIQTFALESLDVSMKMIIGRSGMDLDECFQHATKFVEVTAGPLIAQLNPEKLGEYSRALSVGEEYGKRLLRRSTKWDEAKRNQVIERLVHGYPSHDYIIDYHELKEMGFQVESFGDNEGDAVQGLFKSIAGSETVVKCVHPSSPDEQSNQESDDVTVDGNEQIDTM
jgi:Serine dehydrogenase proteinase